MAIYPINIRDNNNNEDSKLTPFVARGNRRLLPHPERTSASSSA
jgi:hypothetical protein